jgi:hypothetical protein
MEEDEDETENDAFYNTLENLMTMEQSVNGDVSHITDHNQNQGGRDGDAKEGKREPEQQES